MPKRGRSYSSKRRSSKRRRRFGKRRRHAPILGKIVPSAVMVKLPYVHTEELTGGVSYTRTFNLSSLNDPYTTGAGHQPLGHDQWANFYAMYKVFKVFVEVTIVTDGSQPSFAGMWSENDATPTTGITDILEQYNAEHRLLPGNQTKTVKMRRMFDLKKLWGRNLKDTDFGSVMNSNPTLARYCHIHLQATDAISNIVGSIIVKLTYYARLSDRKELTQS